MFDIVDAFIVYYDGNCWSFVHRFFGVVLRSFEWEVVMRVRYVER